MEKEKKKKGGKKRITSAPSGCVHIPPCCEHTYCLPGTHPGAAVKPNCPRPAHWKTRRWQTLFCVTHMTKLHYAYFNGATKSGLLLCLHDKRIQKEVPASLKPALSLLSHWRGGGWTKPNCKISTSEEHCHIPGLCLLQLLQHISLLKKDHIRYKKFSARWR